jgi:hypothetical protein
MILEAFNQSLNQTNILAGNMLSFDYWLLQNPDIGLPVMLGLLFMMNYSISDEKDIKERIKISAGVTAFLSIFLVPLFLGAALQIK